jgi:thiamine kinase-like enzyme
MLSPRVWREAGLDGVHAELMRVPFFEGVRSGSVGLERLGGALTNVSYKVVTDAGAYVLRLAGEGTSDYVDRLAEGHNARTAAAVGINVEVLHFDTRDGTMVTRFVEGATMEGPGCGFATEPGAPVRAALALGRIHRMGRVFRSRFDVFAKVKVYLDLLRELEAPAPESCYGLEREAEAVRRALEASPMPLAPCHNDPWPGNFLDAGSRLYIIDWEYSGMNDPLWDLADLSVEAEFGPEQDHLMMEAYHGGGVSRTLYSRLELYKAMSDLHWTLWGFVQHANGNPAEDFWSYALERLERCKARMGSAGFGRHLSTVLAGRQPHTKTRAYRTNPEWRVPSHKATGSV